MSRESTDRWYGRARNRHSSAHTTQPSAGPAVFRPRHAPPGQSTAGVGAFSSPPPSHHPAPSPPRPISPPPPQQLFSSLRYLCGGTPHHTCLLPHPHPSPNGGLDRSSPLRSPP